MDDKTEKRSGIRLQVYLAHCGVASRRACETYIADGRVSVNGVIITVPGTKVQESDTVCVDGRPVKIEKALRYVLLYKPAGYVCSLSDEKGRATAADLLKNAYSERLYNVGRLDMYSEGLILFTNDGKFAAVVSHPSAELEKEYIVETSIPIPEELIIRFRKGIHVESVFYRCKSIELLSPQRARIVLIEGKNREIRRVFESFSIGIRRLTRVRIGRIRTGNLRSGDFRDLTEQEIHDLIAVCKNKNRF